MRLMLSCIALLFLAEAHAASWQFDAPIPVTSATGPKVFHHLESSGRHNIAVSGQSVAVVWEDDRDGVSRIYLAHKELTAPAFGPDFMLSGSDDAFEPSIVGLGGGLFAVAWEEDGRVHARILGGNRPGPVFTVDAGDSVQASLATNGSELLLASAEREERFARIVLHRLRPGENGVLSETAHCAVDLELPSDEQLYPALTAVQGQIIVAWEDRRPGHTIIMASTSVPDMACRFAPPQRISLRPEGRGKTPYGKGHGVSRVAVAGYGPSAVFAAWADKRDFREGYDIYGASWQAGKGFGANVRVQDEFGGVARQWHASVAGNPPGGDLVVAWDDERDGDPNIMLSWFADGEWSEDTPLPGASGPGVQAHPSITLDADGNLYAAWVERDTVNGPTRLRYAYGRRVAE